jgi:hypothetical protein
MRSSEGLDLNTDLVLLTNLLPLTFDFDVGLINAVGVVRWSQVRMNSLLQLRSIRLNPAVNRRVIEREAALPHHFFEVAITEGVA